MKKYKIVNGDTYSPKKQALKVSENLVSGNRWEVRKEGDSYYFEFDTGGLCETFLSVSITKDDFQKIKSGVYDKKDLMKKYKL